MDEEATQWPGVQVSVGEHQLVLSSPFHLHQANEQLNLYMHFLL